MDISIGGKKLGMLPRVVGAVTDKEISMLGVDTIDRVDVLELRIDMFEEQSINYVEKIFNSTRLRYNKPIIATIRNMEDGGLINMDDDSKYELFKSIILLTDAVDVEIHSTELLKKVSSLCKENNKLLVGSYHNFVETPDREQLNGLVSKAKENNADIVKIAVKANTRDDVANLTSFTTENKDVGLITISLGSIGHISRIFNPTIGSLLTYGHLGTPSAPGQLSALDIVEYLRLFDSAYNDELINRIQLLEFA